MITFLAALALALPPAAPATQGGAPQQGGEEAVPPIQYIEDQDAYRLQFDESGEGMTLEQFIKICQRSTGINFTFSTDTKQLLAGTNVTMFGPKVIPKKDFYSFFQIIMMEVHRGEPAVAAGTDPAGHVSGQDDVRRSQSDLDVNAGVVGVITAEIHVE